MFCPAFVSVLALGLETRAREARDCAKTRDSSPHFELYFARIAPSIACVSLESHLTRNLLLFTVCVTQSPRLQMPNRGSERRIRLLFRRNQMFIPRFY